MLRADRLRSTNGYVEGELAGDSGLISNWNRRPSRKWRRGIEQSGLAQCEVTSPVENNRTLVSHEKVTAENRVKNVGQEFYPRFPKIQLPAAEDFAGKNVPPFKTDLTASSRSLAASLLATAPRMLPVLKRVMTSSER